MPFGVVSGVGRGMGVLDGGGGGGDRRRKWAVFGGESGASHSTNGKGNALGGGLVIRVTLCDIGLSKSTHSDDLEFRLNPLMKAFSNGI